MPDIFFGVKPNEIAMQNTAEDFTPDRQDPIDLATWKGRVQEEPDFDILPAGTKFLSKHGRHQHQVKIVNPDEIPIHDVLGDGFCEEAVRFLVSIPCRLVEGDFTRVVVEERPEY